ncbi:NAD(P)-dependent oxidoreductase [Taibaiella soli]|uniref:Hydroxyacid dehydrogenase n=1 Tax=Taibaiella soli TaxID=1649169 RepID=A0A2W2AE96_9BACT|nr:NAD(P)-dependent oxidoreductase [Taibaiella soli]PZF73785.1 hydroxyacid dehydrogenase [Taibaiella soli]
MNQSGKVLIAAPVHPVLTEGLEAAGYTCAIHEKITQQDAFELIRDCVGVITSTRLLLDKALLDAAPKLQWIGRMGSGMEIIDVPYATEKGIACFSSPEGNRNAVAEHAMGMLLGVTKRIAWSHQEVQKGLWLRDENRGTELEGKTIGIIGYGNTGKAFAKKLLAFDMNILAYDIDHTLPVQEGVVFCQNLDRIFEEAELLSFHLPLTENTYHYFDNVFLQQMTKPFILINTSRGDVVDTNVIWEGLQSKKIKSVCLDVLEGEPLTKMNDEKKQLVHQISMLPNALITPHIAGYSFEAVYKMSNSLLTKIVIPK